MGDEPAGVKLAFLTQTTLSVDDAERIIGVLRRRFPKLRLFLREDLTGRLITGLKSGAAAVQTFRWPLS